jgi:hypothetical protein
VLSDDFTFYSPPDPGIDRAMYFERCWPNSELIKAFEFKRLIQSGDEVFVTYESTKTDGRRFRNTEIHTFEATRSAGWRSTSAGTSDCRVPGW